MGEVGRLHSHNGLVAGLGPEPLSSGFQALNPGPHCTAQVWAPPGASGKEDGVSHVTHPGHLALPQYFLVASASTSPL